MVEEKWLCTRSVTNQSTSRTRTVSGTVILAKPFLPLSISHSRGRLFAPPLVSLCTKSVAAKGAPRLGRSITRARLIFVADGVSQ